MPQVYNKRDKNSPADAVYVGRPSRWGNSYQIGVHGTRSEVIQKFRDSLTEADRNDIRSNLKGEDLVCWCAPLPCHADVLLEIANG